MTRARTGKVSAIGIIAGQGRLPILVAHGARTAGLAVHGLGLAAQFDPEFPTCCDTFRVVGIASLNRWIRSFRRLGVDHAILVGRVHQQTKYQRFHWLRYPPDWRALRLWYGVLRRDRRTATVLSALADELGRAGVTLMDSTTYIRDHLAESGLMTRVAPAPHLKADIEFGWPLFQQLLRLRIGQSMAVANRDVVAVEAAEGTDAMVDRTGEICRGRPWAFLKSASPDHDMRADVPTMGVQTIRRLHGAGCRAVVLGSGRVILLGRSDLLNEANELGLPMLGMDA